jgi:DNA-directed RNA polymerase specialized sigma24 family protein
MCCDRPDDRIEAEIVRRLTGPPLEALYGQERKARRDDIERGVDLAYRHYCDRIRCFVRRRFPYLSSEELADAWVDTVMELMRKALRGRFGRRGSLRHLLRTIVLRRCHDRVRCRVRRAHERFWDEVGEIAEERGLAYEEVDEVYRLLNEAIGELPRVQRAVWEAYRDCGFSATNRELAAYLARLTGARWTVASVRRARLEGQEKVRTYLERRGYDARC